MKISGTPNEDIIYAWEDVKAMFNGGTRKRIMEATSENMIGEKEHFENNIIILQDESLEWFIWDQLLF